MQKALIRPLEFLTRESRGLPQIIDKRENEYFSKVCMWVIFLKSNDTY